MPLRAIVLYGFPFIADIVVGLTLFVGRHSLASRGYDEATVGSVVLVYGAGYIVASLLMSRVIRPALAKAQQLVALGAVVAICLTLANVERVWVIQMLYGIFPFATSMYFNAYQVYMLGMNEQDGRPLAALAGHFTFSWSLGFAAGPFVSSLLRSAVTWSQTLYVAAALAALIGVLLYGFDPTRYRGQPSVAAPSRAGVPARPSLIGPAWVGLLAGWTVYNAVLIYWPVQAVQQGVPPALRGLVEFLAALAQAFSALALVSAPRWQHRPGWLAGLGGVGVGALVVFSAARGVVGMAAAAILYGAFTGSMFSLVVYHSMADPTRAVRRIALNEVIVGICFLLASGVARVLHPAGTSVATAYLGLTALLAVGVAAQVLYATALVRRAPLLAPG
ncbi:MAG: MFS transporter [Anaerolineae bacterium]|jgi:hypothetical protein|nr:MFS transporter [Anaerolineae bacterium]